MRADISATDLRGKVLSRRWVVACAPFTGKEAQRYEMRFSTRTTRGVAFQVRRTWLKMCLTTIATSFVVACVGCAATKNYSEPAESTRIAYQVATAPGDKVTEAGAVVQAQHLAASEEIRPTAELPAAAEKSEAIPSPLPAPAITLDQAISLCLMNDPKIRVGVETINQAHADALTASLKPNPEMAVGGTLLPLSRPITPQQPGGPSEFDLEMGYPIDWFLFGKRAAAMASASAGYVFLRPIMPTSSGSA